ncbi:hypothetical protein B5P43_18485 [Bacillus sp. SRB_336]|nr:hypothetical protein B5P43_18485 [Bacillus sp. SRB_336]
MLGSYRQDATPVTTGDGVVSATGIKYGSFDLQSANVTTTDTDIYSAPNNLVQADKIANADGAVIVKQLYDSKTFTLNGILHSDSILATDALIDQFKAAMAMKNQPLDIDFNGMTRRYLATAQNIVVSRNKGLSSAGFSVQMLSPDGMGWDVMSSSLLIPTSVTTANAALAITIGGSYNAEPLITYTVNTLTGTATNTVTVSNGTTLRGLWITRAWTAGDHVEIDALKKTVFVNNVPTDFKGQFPKWDIGPGVISWLDDFSARDATITASYTARYL